MAREIVLEEVVSCESDLSAIWKGLSDTDWVNRAMGNERLKVEPAASAQSAARYLVKTRLGGFEVAWTERPYEFDFMRSLKVRRDMVAGPVERLDIAYFTEARGANSTVRVRLTLWPRSGFMAPVVRLSAGMTLGRLGAAIRTLDQALLDARGGRPLLLPPSHPVNRERLERAAVALDEAGQGALGRRLVDFVATAPDDHVMRIRPYELADEWGADRRALLCACLLGVRAGLFQLRWEVVCPSCRTGSEAADSLSELSTHGGCQLCDIRFGLELDQALEVTFRPLETIRHLEVGPFCVGSPGRMPHVVSQAIVAPAGRAVLTVPDEVGLFRLFLRGGTVALVQSEAGAATSVELSDGRWPERLTVAPSATITVSASESAPERHVKLERAAWTNLAATARDVMLLPLFRREFSAQVLRPGLSLQVQRVALVFSDLVGSTDLYTHAGDAEAFRFVQAHFEVLTRAIERHGGVVVKTMGDAVMAVFPDELAGVAGARDMLTDFEAFRLGDALGERTSLKVGVHGGPGFVATANKVLDYFGQTVNVAARLQGEAKAGQLVVAESVANEAVANGLVAAAQITERYPARLKGVEAPMPVVRVQVCARPAAVRATG
ncbi:MAG: adenylate/guanylate cyclase domain-containing protein [Myxococcaceae bacterium]|nr:adenylate/guanylate cyclase domain-containing protein [Myxococcaceae bacterium]